MTTCPLPTLVPLRTIRSLSRPNSKLTVVWRINEQCNLDCPFCEYRVSNRIKRLKTAPSEILRFGKVLADYAEETPFEILVSWLGGEPFVYRELLDISRGLAICPGIKLSATTNGSRIDASETLATIAEVFTELTISIDGYGEIHDRTRRKAGLYAQARAVIGELAELRRRPSSRLAAIRINTILHAENIDRFGELAYDLADAGATEITFNQLIGHKDEETYRRLGLSLEQFRAFRLAMPELRSKLAAHHGLRIAGSERYLDRIEAYLTDTSVPVVGCKEVAPSLFIADEKIAPCSFTTASIGVPIQELRDAADFRRFLDDLSKRIQAVAPTACNNCMDPNTFGKFAH